MELTFMLDKRSTVYGKICGILEVFANLNTACNYQCSFSFKEIEYTEGVQSAVEAYFADVTRSVKLILSENWRKDLLLPLEYWLFSFELPPALHPSCMGLFSFPPEEAYQLLAEVKKKNRSTLFSGESDIVGLSPFHSNRRKRLISDFMSAIDLLHPQNVWEVNM